MTLREFETMFRKLYMPLGMYALRIVNDVDTAEDMVQESFMKAWQKIESGTDIDNFSQYMYRSVRNECITHLRQQKEFVELDSIADVSDEDVDTSVRDAKIWRAIDRLPEKCREIFLLSKRDGLTNDEIAEELDISVKTVKNHMTKAFSRLREELSTSHKPFFLPFL